MTNTNPGSLTGSTFFRYLAQHATGHLFLGAQGLDTELVTINGRKVEIDAGGDGGTAGNLIVDTSGDASIAAEVATLVAAINADTNALAIYTAVGVSDSFGGTLDTVAFFADTPGTAGNAITLTTDITSATVSGATFAGGSALGEGETHVIRHTVTTQEATSAFFFLHTPLEYIAEWSAVWEDAGVKKDLTSVVDVVVTVTGSNLIVHEGTAWAAGDVIIMTVSGYPLTRV